MSRDTFAPKSRKVNLIECLTFRALKICSDKIKSEFEQIKNSFLGNGYSEEYILDTINKTVNKFRNDIRPFGLSKCLVYVRHPWIGSPTQLIVDKFSSSVKMRLWYELELHFVLLIRMSSLSFNKAI